MKIRVWGLVLCAWVLSVGMTVHADIIISNFNNSVHDRFENNTNFLLHGVDLSAVGMTKGGTPPSGKWASLVSRNVIVSAFHAPPGIGANITFFETNDPNGNYATRSVTSGQRLGMSDIWVGVLDSPVPVTYTPFPFATEDINSSGEFQASNLFGATANLFGRSPSHNSKYGNDPVTDQAIGENLIDVWVNVGELDEELGDDPSVGAINNIVGEADYLTHETLLQSGDSGGPVVVVNAGVPTMVGANWYIGEVDVAQGPGEDLRFYSGFSYLGNYDHLVQQIIESHPIPEPSTLALVGVGSLVVCLRRRSVRV